MHHSNKEEPSFGFKHFRMTKRKSTYECLHKKTLTICKFYYFICVRYCLTNEFKCKNIYKVTGEYEFYC